ncbi:MAG: P-loop NTPase [Gammaproteobacteria bacterium]|nr:P-loop NTPase [Gammaproteobacteria bacterium]
MIKQFVEDVCWGQLDYLIIDTPPGTGDIHLSLLQNYDINGVVMVTTPQLISKLDVQRAINLYKKFNVPLLGIIENMSYYQDKLNGNSILLFQGNSGNKIAAENNIPLLAKVPIEPELSQYCDQGNDLAPFVHLVPEIKFSRTGD